MLPLKGFGPGGVERIALRLADGWQRAGIRTDVLMARPDGPMRGEASAATIHPLTPWPWIADRWPMLRLTVASLRAVRGHQARPTPMILFCPGNAYTVVAVALKFVLGRHCPPIVAKVSNDLQREDMHPALRPFYRLWLRIQGRAIDHFAVLSLPMAREVMALMWVPCDRVHVVPNPVLSDAELGDSRDLERRPPRAGEGRSFVAVGRLEPQKDYPLMLSAFARGSAPGDRLTIYGEGRERDRIVQLAETLGIADRVHLAGFSSDIPGELRQHDILLLTSAFEGQPGAVIEALAAGLPIIATQCCAGMSELLDEGALGSIIDRQDVDGLVRAIAQARPGSQDRDRSRAKAYSFTIEAAVPAYARLFATALARTQMNAIGGRPGVALRSMEARQP
ncbi:glycosyltransferase [Sphingobium sp. H39-3-25]|uniref:glycosyltransferase n=1 Tax=Sphingobium arseniciresistens TaxID=3030834 RepID=UPI0023B88B3E|nr:glycosyltransferase [Sphingobium arseniciresistens]